MKSLGIYVHVPFCGRSCDFCAFYQEAPDRAGLEHYLADVEREMAIWPTERWAETVFWGGGTPGLLPAADLDRLGEAVLKLNGGQVPREWSVEMAPATVKKDKLRVLRNLGVNRISLGVQSFDDGLLERLGRSHTRRQIDRAIEQVRDSGIERFSIDLMFALPGQTIADLTADLEVAMACGAGHISCYCLTFEEDTALWLRLGRGEVKRFSEKEERAYYECVADVLEHGGFAQYEISNFSRPGEESLHNLNCWRMQDWAAYGPSASGQLGLFRFTREHSLEKWGAGVRSEKPAFAEQINLTRQTLAEDALIFGLRMNAGVDLEQWEQRFGPLPEKGIQFFRRLENEGLMTFERTCLRLTREGRWVADAIGAQILELEASFGVDLVGLGSHE